MTFKLGYNQTNIDWYEVNLLLLFFCFPLKGCEEQGVMCSVLRCGSEQIRKLGIVVC